MSHLSRLEGALIWLAPSRQSGVHFQEPAQSDHVWVKFGLYGRWIQEPSLQRRTATAQLARVSLQHAAGRGWIVDRMTPWHKDKTQFTATQRQAAPVDTTQLGQEWCQDTTPMPYVPPLPTFLPYTVSANVGPWVWKGTPLPGPTD